MYVPHLNRLAASLPVYRGYHIKGNPRFPNLNAWLAALNERPAYNRVKTDAATTLMPSGHLVHDRENLYKNAHQFKPERFLNVI